MSSPIDSEGIAGDGAEAGVDYSIARKKKAFAKIYSTRLSREALRASMIEKSRAIVVNGIGSVEMVTIVEHR